MSRLMLRLSLQALPMFITIAVIRILASHPWGRRDSLAVAVTESGQTDRNNDANRQGGSASDRRGHRLGLARLARLAHARV